MDKVHDRRPYLLALDLGVQSIGWMALEMNEQGQPCDVRLAGVRCFDSGVGSEQQIQMGKDESANAKRREARQHRRQLWRRARRQAKVFHLLQRAGLLPPGESHSPTQRHGLLLALDKELATAHNAACDRVAAHLLPYRLRTKALDGPLSVFALGRAFYHLALRRGFLSNKKAKKPGEEEGAVKSGIAELQKAMEEAGGRTLGEYFAGLDPEEHRIRSRWTARGMYLSEFDAIWKSQAPHHAALTEEYRKKLHHAIFYQRPLKSQKGLIGKCELERGQRRARMALLAAQRFRFWQKINDLEIVAPDGEILALSPEQRRTLAGELETQAEMTFAGVLKTLGLKNPKGAERKYEVNLAAGGETRLKGNRTAAKLLEAMGDRWCQMSDEDRERLVSEVLSFEKEDALARRLVKAWKLDPTTAACVAAIDFEPGYCALSVRAIRKVLPLMQTGRQFASARKEVYGDQTLGNQVYDFLPPVIRAVSQLRNPVVSRALTELRKVVNALVHKCGKPTLVRIEMARDMKRGRKRREEAWKAGRENEQRRTDAKRRILEELKIAEPRPGDILKVRLADECNWQCPYTGRQIEMATLVGDASQFDIEHILPFPRSLDDSFANKTLCYHEENRNVKRNRTPFEAYAGNSRRWEEILQRVRRFHGPVARAKLERFGMDKIPEDFVSRQLNDTRYIARLAGDYIGMLFGGQVDGAHCRRVQVSTGAITAYAYGGTVALNDVAAISMATQSKLVRLVEEGKLMHWGSNAPVKADVRLVGLADDTLEESVNAGVFRRDLYHYLTVATVRLPSLAQRSREFPAIVDQLVAALADKHRKRITRVSPEVRQTLLASSWPGDFAQLRSVIESMVVFDTDEVIDSDDLPDELAREPPSAEPNMTALVGRTLTEIERLFIAETLRVVGGNREVAARNLGIGERTLYRKIKEHRLQEP